MKLRLTSVIAAAIVACSTIFTSCNSESDGPAHAMYSAIVTFNGNYSTGSTYDYMSGAETMPITLFANHTLNSDYVKTGERLAIYFYTETDSLPTTSGPIDLQAVQRIQNGQVRIVPADSVADWASVQTPMTAMWRTGNYINMLMAADADALAKLNTFSLLADATTVNDDYPVLYLINHSSEFAIANTEYIASFNINEVLDIASCKGVIIRVNNTNADIRDYKFSKGPGNGKPE